jgi:hypothetical protein
MIRVGWIANTEPEQFRFNLEKAIKEIQENGNAIIEVQYSTSASYSTFCFSALITFKEVEK